MTTVNLNGATVKDGAGNAANLTGAVANPAGTLQIDTTSRADGILCLVASGTGITAGSGDLAAGSVVTLTVNLSEAVTVNTTGGTPSLTLNDGGASTYTGGSGHQGADLQLHGGGRSEHGRPDGHCGQPQRGHGQGRRRQCG